MSRGDASVLRCYAGNVTSANASYQRHTQLVTEEQSAPHRFTEAHLADRPVTSVIRPIDPPHSGESSTQDTSTSGSSLRPAPPPGIAIDEKCETTRSSVGSSASVACTARCR